MPINKLKSMNGRLLTGVLVGSFVALMITLTVAYWANRNRISDIQDARIEACEHNFEGIRSVFAPFFAPIGKRTEQQQKDIAKFNLRINQLKARCKQDIRKAE